MKENAKETQLVPYDLDTAIIEELKAKYMDVTIPAGDKDAYAMVMGGLKECREHRIECDGWHKGKKAYILKAGKHYDGEKKRVHALIEPIESYLKGVRKAEDDRIETIRLEKEQKERERVEEIMAKIEVIKAMAVIEPTIPSNTMLDVLMAYDELRPGEVYESYGEFIDEAEDVWQNGRDKIQVAVFARNKWEKEEADRKAEAKRLADQKAEQEVAQAKIDEANRVAEENRLANEKRMAAEQKKIDDEKAELEKEKKAEKDRKDRDALEKKLAEEAKVKAEQDAKDKVEREAREKKEAEDAATAKKVRDDELRPDKDKLVEWANSVITMPGPQVKDEAAQEIVFRYVEKFSDIAYNLKMDVEEM